MGWKLFFAWRRPKAVACTSSLKSPPADTQIRTLKPQVHHEETSSLATSLTECPTESYVQKDVLSTSQTHEVVPQDRKSTSVQFDCVETRVYNRIVGDHPDTEIPLAIGWKFKEIPSVPVEAFEEKKQARKEAEKEEDVTTSSNSPCGSNKEEADTPEMTSGSSSEPKRKLRRATAFAEIDSEMKVQLCAPASKYLEPITIQERVHRLQSVAGMSLPQINRYERRRKVQIMMEWAYRSHDEEKKDPLPCSVPKCDVLLRRYIR